MKVENSYEKIISLMLELEELRNKVLKEENIIAQDKAGVLRQIAPLHNLDCGKHGLYPITTVFPILIEIRTEEEFSLILKEMKNQSPLEEMP